MGVIIKVEDLRPYLPASLTDKQIEDWIEDAEATAAIEAPCILKPGFPHKAAARGILRMAIRYHAGAEDGAVTSVSAGGYSMSADTRKPQSSTFFSNGQIAALKKLCPTVVLSGAYSVRLLPPSR